MVRRSKKQLTAIDKIIDDLAPLKVPKREPLETLIRKFLARKKHDGTDAALERLAQDFLEWKPDRWDEKIGAAFWPQDQKYQYKHPVDSRDIAKRIKRIMACQQKKKRGSVVQRGDPAEEDSDSDHDDQLAGPSEGTIEPSRLSAARQQGRGTPARSPELSELPELADFMGRSDANFVLSDQHNDPIVVEPALATPPPTTPRPASRRKGQPRGSIETGESSRQEERRRSPIIRTPHTPASRSSIAEGKHRQRSSTTLLVYHPPIPLDKSGAPDQTQVRAWQEGVYHARQVFLECANDFRRTQRMLEKVNNAPDAQRYQYRGVGVNEALDKLDEDLQVQERRLEEACVQGRDSDMSDEELVHD